ncbi:carbohydrate kinase family protein [Agromyces protaetiae]|uniref:Carbohydrate kinase family protein n=1 Tax=Agromyces protaetiae TaxID=2509455 RepID=A0A4V0YHL0_9MICO|nr:carbohydrate kinase family protein [Agromyces protaetiae]
MLAVVGDLVEDIVVWASEKLRHATDTAAEVFRTRGGSGANVAALAAPLVSTRFIGCVGDDAAGDVLQSALAQSGVDVRVQRRGRSGAVVLLVDATGERTMFPDRGAAALLGPVDVDWLDGVGWLHAPSYGFERQPMCGSLVRLVIDARERGVVVSIDASSTGLLASLGVDEYVELVQTLGVDVFLANEDEAALLGISHGGAPAARLATRVVVKHGPNPTEVFDDGVLVARVEVEPVAVVRDLIGAGDAFAAGFIAASIDGASVSDACLAGHARAAVVLGGPGTSEIPIVNPG